MNHNVGDDSLARASLERRDLWAEAKTGKFQMILCGPETTVDNQAFDAFITGRLPSEPEVSLIFLRASSIRSFLVRGGVSGSPN